jgi:Fic-DOC domain mobile mystery protein B
MADDLFEQPDDASPLRPEEAAALRAPVVDRRHLNEIEAGNVEAGRAWAMRSRKDCLADDYPCDLHRRMFGDVWRWAGDYRTFDVNIGNTPFVQVPMDVRQALGDARYWMEHKTYGPAELAVRLHHRLVLIHPFVNGNGRCTRLLADVIMKRLQAEPLSWGSASLVETGEARAAYVAALREADGHNIDPLLAFAQS